MANRSHDPLITKVRVARILQYLIKNEPANLSQITEYIKNTSSGYLYVVLRELAKDGLILDLGRTKGIHKHGRGPRVYAVTDHPKVKEFIEFIEKQ